MSANATFTIGGMHCVACARTIEKAVGRMPGVASARVDYGTRRADVVYAPERTDPAAIAVEIGGLGYSAEAGTVSPPTGWSGRQRLEFALCVVAAILAHALHLLHRAGPRGHAASNLAARALATLMLVTIGRTYIWRAAMAAVDARAATMDTLVALSSG